MPIHLKLRFIFLFIFISQLWTVSSVLAQVGFPYCESFQTPNTQANTIFGGSAELVQGVLRLTSNENDQNGYVYIDVPFPSNYGIKAEFEYFMYGGTGADGLTVFLFDAETSNFSLGGFGGSLGYAQKNNQPGMTGAYLGLGFDSFGNFSNISEGKQGGFFGGDNSLYPNSITLRKGGSGTSGYEYVIGKMTDDPPFGDGDIALDVEYRFPLSSGGVGTQRVTDPNQVGYRKVFLELEPHPTGPGFLVKLEMEVTTEAGKPRLVTIFPGNAFPYVAPENLKIGFAGSTGGENNFHEIRNLKVEVSADEELQNPTAVDFEALVTCEGQENTFEITEEDVLLPNESSEIRCLQFYQTLEEIENQSTDICTQARCLEENRYLILEEGILEAGDKGAYTFLPNAGTAGKEVEIYYTITDNYGKASAGNKIKFVIKESPEPVSLITEGGEDIQEQIKICEGEEIRMVATGEGAYTKYVWYRDGELLAEENTSLLVSEEGEYEVWAFNEQNCPAKSNKVHVVFPVFQNLEFEERIVGCIPEAAVDIFQGQESYDPTEYDYLLEGEGIVLENEQILSLNRTGFYFLSNRPKGYDCYSPPVEVEVVIQETELVADFDFVVSGTEIRDDASGGIFPDDPIQFTDLSDPRAISWEWDFGEGTLSEEKNPVHVFGIKGEYDVKLTITDELGCQAEAIHRLSITKSYRLMFPTGFTPSLESNQLFAPKYKGLVEAELLIFDVWGELIFRSEGVNADGWDGKLDGVLLEPGVFVYRFNGTATDGEKVKEGGKFKLIR
ncbi:PKD domain-containing protein [Algoriphagus vanfongensis]|uniref:PKD domain-containing protein n=1 Tax=Algoriphagus vanfongensis TaxID=426371 RepID=UPI00047DE84E|nr:PKD domain-containing protein [Algoriphagus vanfongensis]